MVKIIPQCEEIYLKLRNSVKPKHNKHENCTQEHHNQIAQNSDKEKILAVFIEKKIIYRGGKKDSINVLMETIWENNWAVSLKYWRDKIVNLEIYAPGDHFKNYSKINARCLPEMGWNG